MPNLTNNIDLGSLLTFYEHKREAHEAVSHNFAFLRCVRGGLRMAQRHRISFDPRNEYWRLPERRLSIAYLAARWTGRFAPPEAMRSFARRLLHHADMARLDGVVSYKGVDYDSAGGLEGICNALAAYARTLTQVPEWNDMRTVWPKIDATAGDDFGKFLQECSKKENWEPGFAPRLPWFGYLGADSDAALRERQSFFFGFANLWTATNAYRFGGAMGFSPVIQNTSTDRMLDPSLAWANGKNPTETGFLTLGKFDLDDAPQDRSEHAPVVEVYGFLNLERAPFYNNRAETYRKLFGIDADVNAYGLMRAVGEITSTWLDQNANAIATLVGLFRSMMSVPLVTPISFESVDSPKVKKHLEVSVTGSLDHELLEELDSTAKNELARLTDRDSAALMLNLLLDSRLMLGESTESTTQVIENPRPISQHNISAERPHSGLQLTLPPALRHDGERALGYLRAGFHVLFAGAPGTGKTTLAQFVGYAWNRDDALPDHMPLSSGPLTTVGNSAWSAFHTIGGFFPTEKGIKAHGGIFIDPESVESTTWRLRNSAVVLDEMNRADLDKCIGELYPLLSRSAECVSPAGLPGVQSVTLSPKFRVLATVNDSRLDDIVFPISEGLARRFVRIELPGASEKEVLAFVSRDETSGKNDRKAEASDAIEAFFDHVRDLDLLTPDEDDNRLPFGVAYFSVLQAWVDGRLSTAVTNETESEGAKRLLVASLRTLGTARKWSDALRSFLSKT